MASATAASSAGPGAIRTLAGLGLLAGPLLSMIDSSIVNVAVPDIGRELHAGVGEVQWIVSGYLLSLGITLSATAFLARRFGTLRVYRVSLVSFLIASAGCALAATMSWLIVFRVAQGIAGAPLIPLALSILLGGRGVGASGRMPISAALVLFAAPALGPSLGGLLIGAGGWRWIFLINIPIGLVGCLLTARLPKDLGHRSDRAARLDVVGLLFLATGVASVLFGAATGAADGWGGGVPVAGVLVGTVFLGGYAIRSRRSDHPVLDLRVLRGRNGLLVIVLQTVCSIVAFATLFLVPVFTQGVQGHSAFATGIALLPQGIVIGVGTIVGQRLAARLPLVVLVSGGFGVLAVASIALLLLRPDTPLWQTALLLTGRAVAIGLVTAPLLRTMLAPLADDELADGNTVFTITQRIGGALGVSVFASLLVTTGGEAAVMASFRLVGGVLVALALAAALGALFLRSEEPRPGSRRGHEAVTTPRRRIGTPSPSRRGRSRR
ncbi:DHA2 family efflux MFS transporter permease subunit [Plantibacter sp. YIM 135347]|uniref:DHA2 family efflux MFS transporter permease subunit n=1 Tax=Plantibacter sp. YIM 135347 TaxID=3423919 RepID=UPI003D3307E1